MTPSTNLSLESIFLKNFVTFVEQKIDFSKEFNVLVGETGSGKSLILDALTFLFGQRADKKFVRKNSDLALIEGTFTIQGDNVIDFFKEHAIFLEDNQFTLKRVLSKDGPSRCFVDNQSCSLNVLKDFSRKFIDFVGQFDNQKLLSSKYQLSLLDLFEESLEDLESYQKSFEQLRVKKNNLERIIKKEEGLAQRLDYLSSCVQEIEAIEPCVDDEKNLLEAKSLFKNHKKICETLQRAIVLLSNETDEDPGIIFKFNRIKSLLEGHKNILDKSLIEQCFKIEDILLHLSQSLEKSYPDEFNEQDFAQVLDRLDNYQKLKQKFGPTTDDVLKSNEKFIKEKNELLQVQSTSKSLLEDVNALEKTCFCLAQKLHDKRTEKAYIVQKLLTKALHLLKMDGATVDIRLEKQEILSPRGITTGEFFVQTNPGEGFYPLNKIVSGGELSRILLAIRQTFRSSDSISIFLFDEVDSGIGGETALKIGQVLKSVSQNSQVIAITHLPQIATYGSNLISIKKKTSSIDGALRTFSEAITISKENAKTFVKQMTPLE